MTTTTAAPSPVTIAHVVAAARRIYADHGARVTVGRVVITVEGGRFTMRDPRYWCSVHSIAAEATVTSLARLVAHLAGFVGVEIFDVERALREHPAVDAAPTPSAPATTSARRPVSNRGPGGIVYTPATDTITLPFGRGQASLEATLAGDLALTPAQLRWLDRIVDEVLGEDA